MREIRVRSCVGDAVDTARLRWCNQCFESDRVRLRDGSARNRPAVVGEGNSRKLPDRFGFPDYLDTVQAFAVVHSRIIFIIYISLCSKMSMSRNISETNKFFSFSMRVNISNYICLQYLKRAYLLQRRSSEINEGVVIGKADVLREIGKLMFTVGQIGGIINGNNNGVVFDALCNDVLGFLDDPSVEI